MLSKPLIGWSDVIIKFKKNAMYGTQNTGTVHRGPVNVFNQDAPVGEQDLACRVP